MSLNKLLMTVDKTDDGLKMLRGRIRLFEAATSEELLKCIEA